MLGESGKKKTSLNALVMQTELATRHFREMEQQPAHAYTVQTKITLKRVLHHC
jgi:hypothetical protein